MRTDEVHQYETRQSKFNFLPPKPNTNSRKKSFGYRGAVILDNLPTEVKVYMK